MKRYLLYIFIAISFHFPLQAFAVSGTCSDHGGVNCSAMADFDGSAVCNDGWRDSTETFYSTLECKNLHHLCTQAESYQINQKYDLTGKSNKMSDIYNQVSQLVQQSSAIPIQTQQNNANTGATDSGIAPQNASALRENSLKALALQEQYNNAETAYWNAWNQDMSECWTLGDKEYASTMADAYKLATTQAQIPTCPINSYYSNGSCYCSEGTKINQEKTTCVVDIKPILPGCNSYLYFSSTTGLSCDGTNQCIAGKQLDPEKNKCVLISVNNNITSTSLKKDTQATKQVISPIIDKTSNTLNIAQETKIVPSVYSTPIPVKKLTWYQKVFSWLFK